MRKILAELFKKHPKLKKSLVFAAYALSVIAAGPAAPIVSEAIKSLLEKVPKTASLMDASEWIISYLDEHPDLVGEVTTALADEVFLERELKETIEKAIKEETGTTLADIRDAINQIKYELSARGEDYPREEIMRLESEVSRILAGISEVKSLVSYYYVPSDHEEVLSSWGLPENMDEVLVLDDEMEEKLIKAESLVLSGKNIVVLGEPGVGKTVFLYALWKRLWSKYNVALISPGSHVRRDHEKRGFILFFDDLTESYEVANSIRMSGARGIIVSARTAEWDLIPPHIKRAFTPIYLDRLKDSVMMDILDKHLSSWGILYTQEAADIVVRKADGLPVYIWMVTRELRDGGIKELDASLASRIPAGMIEYIEEILHKILFEKDHVRRGAYTTALTLLCFTDLAEYRMHVDHVKPLFRELSELVKRSLGSDDFEPSTLRRALKYLIRDAKTFTYRLPHDSWADVIRKGEEDSLTAVVFDWAREIRSPERWIVLKKTSESTWRKVYEDAMFSSDENDLLRALYMAYLHAINFGEVLDGFTDIIEYKPEHRISSLLSDLIEKIKSGDFYPGKVVDLEEGSSLEDRVRTTFRRMHASFSPLPVTLEGDYSSISDSNVIWDISELWRVHTGDWVTAVSIGRSGTVYAGGGDKIVRAISPDGKEIWSLNLGGWITTIGVGPDETVYVGSEQSVIAVRRNRVLWNKRLDGWVKAIAVDERGIYVGSDDKMLHIFKDGMEVWRRKLEKAVLALAVSQDGTLYVGAGDILRAIKDGREIWTRRLEKDVLALAVSQDGTLYVGAGEVLRAFRDGKEVWRKELGGKVRALAVSQDGTLYVGAGDILRAIKDGREIWTRRLEGSIYSIAVDDEGSVYIGLEDTTVRKLSPRLTILEAVTPLISGENVIKFRVPKKATINIDDRESFIVPPGEFARKVTLNGGEHTIVIDMGDVRAVSRIFALEAEASAPVRVRPSSEVEIMIKVNRPSRVILRGDALQKSIEVNVNEGESLIPVMITQDVGNKRVILEMPDLGLFGELRLVVK